MGGKKQSWEVSLINAYFYLFIALRRLLSNFAIHAFQFFHFPPLFSFQVWKSIFWNPQYFLFIFPLSCVNQRTVPDLAFAAVGYMQKLYTVPCLPFQPEVDSFITWNLNPRHWSLIIYYIWCLDSCKWFGQKLCKKISKCEWDKLLCTFA